MEQAKPSFATSMRVSANAEDNIFGNRSLVNHLAVLTNGRDNAVPLVAIYTYVVHEGVLLFRQKVVGYQHCTSG